VFTDVPKDDYLHLPIKPRVTDDLLPPGQGEVKPPSYLSDGTLGIDMVSLTVPIGENFDVDCLHALLGGNRQRGTVSIPGFPTIYASFNHIKFSLNLRFNPSNFSRDQGLEICPIEKLPDIVDLVVRQVFDMASKGSLPPYEDESSLLAYIDPKTGEKLGYRRPWKEMVTITSIDVARRLVASDERFSLQQMADLHPKGYPAVLNYRNGGQLNTVTHTSGKKSPRFKIYNKTTERSKRIQSGKTHLLPLEQGTYRFEVHVPRKFLIEKLHIDTLSQLSAEKFEEIAHVLWEKSNYGTPLHWEGLKVQELLATEINSDELFRYVGWQECEIRHVKMPLANKPSDDFWDQLKNYGIDPTKSIFKQGAPYAKWDFESGLLETY